MHPQSCSDESYEQWSQAALACSGQRNGSPERQTLPEFRRQSFDIAKDRRHILLQFLQQLARVAVLRRLAALGPVAGGGEVPVLVLDGIRFREPPVFRPGFCGIGSQWPDIEVLTAVATGDVTPLEAEAVLRLLEGHAKVLEVRDLEERITTLELKAGTGSHGEQKEAP